MQGDNNQSLFGITKIGKTLSKILENDSKNSDRSKLQDIYSSLKFAIFRLYRIDYDDDLFNIIYTGLLNHYLNRVKNTKFKKDINTHVENLIKTELKIFKKGYNNLYFKK